MESVDDYIEYTHLSASLGINLEQKAGSEILGYFTITPDYYFNFSYNSIAYGDSIQNHDVQFGLWNEIGIQNISIYFRAGPIMNLWKNFYISPGFGVGFALLAGPDGGGIGFIYYGGICSGAGIQIFNGIGLNVEAGIQFFPKINSFTYLKLGISHSLH